MARQKPQPGALADGETLDEAGTDPLPQTALPGAPNPLDPAPTLPGALPAAAGPDVGELEEKLQDRDEEIERLRAQLVAQAEATAQAQRAAAAAVEAANRAIAAASKKVEIASEPPLGPDAPHPKFDPSRPAAQIYGPAGHVGWEQMRGGRTFRYRKNHDPWPDGVN